jgi:hypothetical protein
VLKEELVRIQGLSKNARLDLRHLMPKPYVEPSTAEIRCWIYRCSVKYDGCGKLVTEWKSKKYGGCPHCGCRYMIGTKLRGFREWFPLWLAYVFYHWHYWGPQGWGWTKPIKVGVDRGKELEGRT